jgi:putative membrane protein
MKFINSLLIFLKGMAMGAADVVPGVSGGTIAFISGIYDPLIKSISSFDLSLIQVLRKEGFAAFWQTVNGSFLLLLFAGIATSVFSLARLLSALLDTQPIAMWSFFLGLIAASILLVGRQIQFNALPYSIGFFGIGMIAALSLTFLNPVVASDSWLYFFLSGALAICAMILPGISGSFILVLLGSYQTVLDAVHERNLSILFVVGLGAAFGLLSFSKLLKWLFSTYRNPTLTILVGFIAGSLPKVWPWKNELTQLNLYMPSFETASDQLSRGIGFAVLGFVLVVLLEYVGSAVKKSAEQ